MECAVRHHAPGCCAQGRRASGAAWSSAPAPSATPTWATPRRRRLRRPASGSSEGRCEDPSTPARWLGTAPRQDQAVQQSGPRSVAPDCGADGAAASAGPGSRGRSKSNGGQGFDDGRGRGAAAGRTRGTSASTAVEAPWPGSGGRGAWVSVVPPVDRVRQWGAAVRGRRDGLPVGRGRQSSRNGTRRPRRRGRGRRSGPGPPRVDVSPTVGVAEGCQGETPGGVRGGVAGIG